MPSGLTPTGFEQPQEIPCFTADFQIGGPKSGPTEDREYKTPDISPSELASLIERLFTTSTDNIPAILDEYKPDELRLILSALGVS
ncbi:MAG TPA: hypothetical protein PLS55_15365, partial [Thermogutta sp.]|nr:hypothetical protein [Thermogutta sp.]